MERAYLKKKIKNNRISSEAEWKEKNNFHTALAKMPAKGTYTINQLLISL